jgi:hypothetical protein
MWHKHTRWLGRTKRAKENERAREVEPDGHARQLAAMSFTYTVGFIVP